MTDQALIEAVASTPPPPCELGCEHRARCADELLACARFHAYAGASNTVIKTARQRGESLHEPSRWRYDKVFQSDD